MQAIAGLCLTLSAKSSLRFKFSAMTALATLLTGAVGRYRHELAPIVYLVEQFHEYRPLPKLSKSGQHPSDLSCPRMCSTSAWPAPSRAKRSTIKAFTRGVNPVEFVMTGVMIFMKREMHSSMQLSNDLENMRADVRSREKDIMRGNMWVSRPLFGFILAESRPAWRRARGSECIVLLSSTYPPSRCARICPASCSYRCTNGTFF